MLGQTFPEVQLTESVCTQITNTFPFTFLFSTNIRNDSEVSALQSFEHAVNANNTT